MLSSPTTPPKMKLTLPERLPFREEYKEQLLPGGFPFLIMPDISEA